ncbi:hypothetical protein FJY94_01920 [Candidatus Kaiserbacteria bacterium]|nr:hypothetical protein [Candidatus Kaiserbacteria bacterium]
MLARIFSFLLAGLLIIIVAAWFLGGGWEKMKAAARGYGNPFQAILSGGSFLGSDFRLPGSPIIPEGAGLGDLGDLAYVPESDASFGNAYELDARTSDARSFGTPSPYALSVSLRIEHPGTEQEYAIIESSGSEVIMTGWSLQSALTRVRVSLPHAAPMFVVGAPNTLDASVLRPGGIAVVSSGMSPVGVSFRENLCSGYLGQLQQFSPPFAGTCPTPTASMPRTPAAESRLGASCFEYLATLPACTFPGASLPTSLPAMCRATIAERLTYNGCFQSFSARSDFYRDQWRLFLGTQAPLWRADSDIVRLLDAEERTVATYSY